MAQILRLKLHALCSSRLPSPALASKLLRSPGPRLASWRWYGEGALLEDHSSSTSDTDGGSMAASLEDSLAKDHEENKGSTKSNQSQAEGRLSVAAEGSSKSADDKWQQMVSNIRALAFKKKPKGSDVNTSASSKSEPFESAADFSDLDLPQAGASRSPMTSNREPLAMNTFGKNPKQKFPPSQNFNQQKSKDSRQFQDLSRPNKQKGGLDFDKLEFSDESDDSEEELFLDIPTKPTSPQKNQQRNKDVSPNLKNKDSNFPLASEGVISQNGNPQARKNVAQDPFHSKLSRGSDDTLFSAKGTIPPTSREAAPQALSNSNGASKQSYMVCVQNLPPTSNPAMVKALMAVHGEVTGLFKKPVQSDRLDVFIQFKTAEAMESALAARKLQFGSKTSYIVRTDNSVFTTVVRVSRVTNPMDESQLRSLCMQYGKVDDIQKRSFGVFDVFYDVKELTNIPNIVNSINEVKLNRSTLYALPAPLLHPSVEKEALKSPEGQSWHDSQVFQALSRIEAGLDVVSVLFEDLKELNLVAKEYSK